MACYRNGGCGPYEGRPCSECPASKPEYVYRHVLGNHDATAFAQMIQPIKIKVFINENGVSCVMKDTCLPVEIEIIDEVAVQHSTQYCDDPGANADEYIDAYINQLCGDGFVYVEEGNISVTNNL